MKSTFSYTGKVTLKTFYKGVQMETFVLNSGTDLLFNTIARALVGQNISDSLPTYIDIKDNDKSILRSPAIVVPLLVTPTNNQNTLVARMSATITSSMLTSGDSVSNNISLDLQSSKHNKLASVNISDEGSTIINNLSSGTQLVIVWDMCVNNGEGGNA